MKIKGKPCPKCGKKSLSHPSMQNWSNWKDTTKVICRSCKVKYKVKDLEKATPEVPQ